MRRSEKEIKDRAELEQILKTNSICRLGMVHEGTPYIVPMNYGYADAALYMHSAREGRKIDVLRADNYVCFEIESGAKLVKAEEACSWTTHYTSIIGYGHVELIDDPAGKRHGLGVLMSQYSDGIDWEFPGRQLDRVLVLRLDIESMSGKRSG
ncbi:MAG: pyridoxamine 5'-phosphate oxidase family protein [Spirochaetota bacterium]|nr:pyridoxamine 5'-phosphate oxidase family protein [Spirochaetota bacterium]